MKEEQRTLMEAARSSEEMMKQISQMLGGFK